MSTSTTWDVPRRATIGLARWMRWTRRVVGNSIQPTMKAHRPPTPRHRPRKKIEKGEKRKAAHRCAAFRLCRGMGALEDRLGRATDRRAVLAGRDRRVVDAGDGVVAERLE